MWKRDPKERNDYWDMVKRATKRFQPTLWLRDASKAYVANTFFKDEHPDTHIRNLTVTSSELTTWPVARNEFLSSPSAMSSPTSPAVESSTISQYG
eukprot:741286-Pyramimonas_sp.AAC.1